MSCIPSGKNTAPNTESIAPGSTRNVVFSFAGQLDDGELLTGTPTAAASVVAGAGEASDLTVSGVGRNEAAETVDGETVAIDQGVVFAAACDANTEIGTMFAVKVSCGTDGSQSLVGWCRLEVSY